MPSPEEQIRALGVSPAMSAAYDVLDDAGQLTEQRLAVVYAAEKQGKDPEAFARHLVKLCRAVQSTTGAPRQT